MNPLHLFWIIPLTLTIGAVLMAIIAGGDCDPYWYDKEE